MAIQYYAEEMRLFWEYIAERHRIYKKKTLFHEQPPWTEDPILRNFKFTCVFRELDRGTQFVTNHVLKLPGGRVNVLYNVIVYRLFNKLETFLHHGPLDYKAYDKDALRAKLWELSLTQKVFTNAFTVSGYSQYGQGLDKITRLSILLGDMAATFVKDEAAGIIQQRIFDTTKMEDAYYWLRTISGLGPFLGYQIAVDLSYWDKTKFDEDHFVVDGPGAKRGIQWLFPQHEIDSNGYEMLNFWLRDNQQAFWKDYRIDHHKLFDDRPTPYLTVMALENALCEISKYMKAYRGQGRPRNTYSETEGFGRANDPQHNRWNRAGR